jgi:hypothetical protein
MEMPRLYLEIESETITACCGTFSYGIERYRLICTFTFTLSLRCVLGYAIKNRLDNILKFIDNNNIGIRISVTKDNKDE